MDKIVIQYIPTTTTTFIYIPQKFLFNGYFIFTPTLFFAEILRDRTIDDKLIYVTNVINRITCVVETFCVPI